MKTFLAFVAPLMAAIVLLDCFLPPDKMDTSVYSSTVTAASGSEIVYNVPLSGGASETCKVSEDTARKLPAQSEVIVATSAIFGRCTGVHPFTEPQDIDRAAFIETAIQYAYRDVYANLDQLQADYPGFTPRIRIWANDPWFLPASTRVYSVQLPKELVLVNPSGRAEAIRKCGATEGYCKTVAPARAMSSAAGTGTQHQVIKPVGSQ
ncbi:MAG: hypothetical protein V4858_05645 [Pseudomonadota bacterium]